MTQSAPDFSLDTFVSFVRFCLILGIIPIGHTNIFIVSRCYIFSFQLLLSLIMA